MSKPRLEARLPANKPSICEHYSNCKIANRSCNTDGMLAYIHNGNIFQKKSLTGMHLPCGGTVGVTKPQEWDEADYAFFVRDAKPVTN